MKKSHLLTLMFLAFTLGMQNFNPAQAKSTRNFSGSNPAEVEKMREELDLTTQTQR
jgi:hypothetical protein